MSRFRNNKAKPTIDVCGKTPVTPILLGLKTVISNLSWSLKNDKSLPQSVKDCLDNYESFTDGMTRNNSVPNFFSVTKEHEPKSSLVQNDIRNGWIVSLGMLRLLGTTLLPLTLGERYAVTHRGDNRKKETKSMDWVKPDFKALRGWFKLLDTIWFVKESNCDVVESTGTTAIFTKVASFSRYSYRMRNHKINPLTMLFMSKRYEATSWFNLSKKCYYDDHSTDVWKRANNDYMLLRSEGITYDTIMSELAMSLD